LICGCQPDSGDIEFNDLFTAAGTQLMPRGSKKMLCSGG